MASIFLKKVPAQILLALRKGINSVTKISRETNISYPYVTRNLNKFEKLGLVYFEVDTKGDARIKNARLTERGKELVDAIAKILELEKQVQSEAQSDN